MSALRAYQDGHPVWVRADDGARAHGSYRSHDSRPSNVVGDMVPVIGLVNATTAARRAQMAAYRARVGKRCGAIMDRTSERCFRMAGHKDCHRSEWVMRDEAKRRRRHLMWKRCG